MSHPAAILKARGLHASKRRGQNFLLQPSTAQAIAASAGLDGSQVVVEIGCGLGALTLALAPLARRVIALEVDRGVHEAFAQILTQSRAANVELRLADALEFAWLDEAKAVGAPLTVLGNLPYGISSPLLFALLDNLEAWQSATLMVQREVATRLQAGPGGRDYGRLSVLVQCWCRVRAGQVVGPEQFFPRPQVESQVVHLTPRQRPLAELNGSEDAAWFSRVVKAAFGMRRKTLANALAGGLGRPRGEIEQILLAEGIEPSRRAETLSVVELGRTAQGLRKGPDGLDRPAPPR
jgi:16S rRNA (adenine1518-N6/adenine1519-N6)-dimethyltransferase